LNAILKPISLTCRQCILPDLIRTKPLREYHLVGVTRWSRRASTMTSLMQGVARAGHRKLRCDHGSYERKLMADAVTPPPSTAPVQ
jgi:hypothetical protein